MDIITRLKSKKFYHVYQPIWNIKEWKIIGYESLLRISQEPDISLEAFFADARKENYLSELDTFLINNTIEHYQILSSRRKKPLFINIFPSTIIHESFDSLILSLLEKFPAMKGKIIFELNETVLEEELWDSSLFKEKITFLKDNQFQIALDDFGKGIANFEKILEISPSYLKLDRYFSNNLAFSTEKQKLVHLLMDFADEKMKIILEGIEEETDLAMTKALKVPFGQGFLLGKPEMLV
ncbi:hypothetical protein CHH55_22480 [Niallia circulans]|uniref:EAL domain-containing protein n=1 Tax=Niallia TaxID=2837506 RepID=UPI000BA72E9E|nr:EAL domain-containing protein [Niallia circulans]MCM2981767.1 EAL domain-containing protein [Niallia circulans]MED5099740.1 EAL domain-containing protein [Niallia circulans]PAD23283.1 hypothetical protein CHH62_23250 [Niallia circulans]PAD85644.1 hypothetical protein CHH55_22480 [Niallia circulans]